MRVFAHLRPLQQKILQRNNSHQTHAILTQGRHPHVSWRKTYTAHKVDFELFIVHFDNTINGSSSVGCSILSVMKTLENTHLSFVVTWSLSLLCARNCRKQNCGIFFGFWTPLNLLSKLGKEKSRGTRKSKLLSRVTSSYQMRISGTSYRRRGSSGRLGERHSWSPDGRLCSFVHFEWNLTHHLR